MKLTKFLIIFIFSFFIKSFSLGMIQRSEFEDMPNEIILLIIDFLDLGSFNKFLRTNSRMYEICQNKIENGCGEAFGCFRLCGKNLMLRKNWKPLEFMKKNKNKIKELYLQNVIFHLSHLRELIKNCNGLEKLVMVNFLGSFCKLRRKVWGNSELNKNGNSELNKNYRKCNALENLREADISVDDSILVNFVGLGKNIERLTIRFSCVYAIESLKEISKMPCLNGLKEMVIYADFFGSSTKIRNHSNYIFETFKKCENLKSLGVWSKSNDFLRMIFLFGKSNFERFCIGRQIRYLNTVDLIRSLNLKEFHVNIFCLEGEWIRCIHGLIPPSVKLLLINITGIKTNHEKINSRYSSEEILEFNSKFNLKSNYDVKDLIIQSIKRLLEENKDLNLKEIKLIQHTGNQKHPKKPVLREIDLFKLKALIRRTKYKDLKIILETREGFSGGMFL